MENVQNRCAKVVSEVMDVNIEQIDLDTTPENLDEWDSLTHVQLVIELEKEFDIQISPEEGIEYFTSFKGIVQFISNKKS
ncbi:acyl carrier protein [Desulfospira joergensenii]|uniref:acyl carrier protein n=1 Tax=Desulfospira joergensenii TaxID=53329 RepID=UPI0003B5C471|nr:acyl carrier protein [Desulfospira joergensenii]